MMTSDRQQYRGDHMMNIYYHDRIKSGLDEIEHALSKLNYGDAKSAAAALADIRNLVDRTYELSKHAEHVWEDCAIEIGQSGKMGQATINPQTGKPYTYGDQWAARYELIRREIVRRFAAGYTIWFMPP